MKKANWFTKTVLCVVAIGVSGLIIQSLFQLHRVEAQGAAQPVKWEYSISKETDGVGDWNKFGEQGWEAFTTHPDTGQMIFKRRR